MHTNDEGASVAGPLWVLRLPRLVLIVCTDILYNKKTRVNLKPPVIYDRQTGAQGIVFVSKPHFLKKYGDKVIFLFCIMQVFFDFISRLTHLK